MIMCQFLTLLFCPFIYQVDIILFKDSALLSLQKLWSVDTVL